MKRRTKKAPTTPSSVFPKAIPREVATFPAVVKLTKNAPIKTAGQNLEPKRRKEAIAIPVGAQIGVALGLKKASRNPNLPAIKYNRARTTIMTISLDVYFLKWCGNTLTALL